MEPRFLLLTKRASAADERDENVMYRWRAANYILISNQGKK